VSLHAGQVLSSLMQFMHDDAGKYTSPSTVIKV